MAEQRSCDLHSTLGFWNWHASALVSDSGSYKKALQYSRPALYAWYSGNLQVALMHRSREVRSAIRQLVKVDCQVKGLAPIPNKPAYC